MRKQRVVGVGDTAFEALVQYLDRLDLDFARGRAEAYEAGRDPGIDSATLRDRLGL